MGTKNEPGKFDCYAKAGDDEPIFTLRAKDPTAGMVVAYWISLNTDNQPPEKIAEAWRCAIAMAQWQLDNA